MKLRWLKFVVMIVVVLTGGCSSSSYESISVEEAQEMMKNTELEILDVRTPDEYAAGHIPGSKLVPLQVLEGMSEELNKNSTYLIVCRSGNRSQQASDLLIQKGFKQIYNMTGGMNEWTGEVEVEQ
jgi:rhodanese-related sulfurtransferase